jgi:hypothetical protein
MRRRGALVATVGGALLLGGLTAPLIVSDIRPGFGPATARLGGLLILAGILTALRRDAVWWQAAAAAFVAVDLLTFGWPLLPTVDRALYRGETTTASIISGERDQVRVYWPSDPDHQRRDFDAQYRVKFNFLTFDDFGPSNASHWRGMREAQLPNAGMLDSVASANSFDPLLVDRYADLLDAAVQAPGVLRAMGVTHVASDRSWSEGEPVHSAGSVTFYRLPDVPGRAWIVSSARQAPFGEALAMLAASHFDPGVEVLVEEALAGESSATATGLSSARLVLQDGPNCVTIRATVDAPGYLVLADTWYPGWQATIDTEPAALLRANHAFRAVQLDKGEHQVEMRYRPRSVLVGGITTLTVLTVFIVAMAVSRRGNARS